MRVMFPEFRAENDLNPYPFEEGATLTNGTVALLDGTLLDAVLHPIGGQAGMYLSSVAVTHDTVTVFIGDADDAQRCSGTFSATIAPASLALVDALGRPAGLLVSEPLRLGLLASWGVGVHEFEPTQTPFAATVCVPVPAEGVRGVLLDDGTLLTDEVWLIGGDGVVLRYEASTPPASQYGVEVTNQEVIRVDVVGDPLFRRRLCQADGLFATPNFVTSMTFTDGHQTIVCGPDAYGDIRITVNNDLAEATVLRVTPSPEGTRFEVVGSPLLGT